MPIFQSEQIFPCSIDEVFAFYACPGNLIDVSPADLNLTLESGPEESHLGARITIRGRRMGVSQTIVSEVTQFDRPHRIVGTMREGPFKKWIQELCFEEVPQGTKVIEIIDFEPPGGLLGLILNADFIEKDLKRIDEHRRPFLVELLGTITEESDER